MNRLTLRVTGLITALAAWMAGPLSAQDSQRETTAERDAWLPELVFPAAEGIDQMFNIILVLTSVVGIVVLLLLVVFLIQYRHKPGRRARFIHGDNRVEAAWTLIPAVILVLISAMSQATWSDLKNPPISPGDEDVVEVRVVAQQFLWNFQYPGADGKLGPRRADLVDPNAGDPAGQIGLDRSHPDGADDVVTQTMVIPVDRKVYIHLTSRDVIHSFFLPNFRVKQDAVPGLSAKVWLEATRTSAEVIGTDPANPLRALNNDTFQYVHISDAKPFDIVCAELCGQGHYKMRGQLYVVTAEQFDRWIEVEQNNVTAGDDDAGGFDY
ncbi:MAG: cytochrome c oxidase subunit II [Phycisphaeraceae bacterium]|nr:cytochrome c oxidase subunit II [Phycisphaeraceae bacterium]